MSTLTGSINKSTLKSAKKFKQHRITSSSTRSTKKFRPRRLEKIPNSILRAKQQEQARLEANRKIEEEQSQHEHSKKRQSESHPEAIIDDVENKAHNLLGISKERSLEDFDKLVGGEDGIDIEKEPVSESELRGRSQRSDSYRNSQNSGFVE